MAVNQWYVSRVATTSSDLVNLNALRIFLKIYKTRSISEAARELHLTQSGASQHLKNLEDRLNTVLFDRISKRLVPTPQGDKLARLAGPALNSLREALMQVSPEASPMSGALRIGMPVFFGVNHVLPVLAEIGLSHPQLSFSIDLDFAAKINSKLLSGELDLALVDDFQMDRRIELTPLTTEIFELCALDSYVKNKESVKSQKQYFENLEYVAYQDGEHVIRRWISHHLKKQSIQLKVRAKVMDVEGVAQLIIQGLGAGILPREKVEDLIRRGHHLHCFNGSKTPLKNQISLARVKDKTTSYSEEFVFQKLLQSLKS